VSGNVDDGIQITGNGTVLVGNFIGTDITGTATIPNGAAGVHIVLWASNNTIGGITATQRNVISGNAQQGILIDGATATGNVIQGNFIGTNAVGTAAIPNGTVGVPFVGEGRRRLLRRRER
jgi:hypothetical protein